MITGENGPTGKLWTLLERFDRIYPVERTYDKNENART